MSEPGPSSDTDHDVPPGMPRWVKVSALIAGLLVLLFLVLHLTGIAGQPGPQRHMSGMPAPASAPAALSPASPFSAA